MEALKNSIPEDEYQFTLKEKKNIRPPRKEEKNCLCRITPALWQKEPRFDEIEANTINRFWDEIDKDSKLQEIYLEKDEDEKKKWLEE